MAYPDADNLTTVARVLAQLSTSDTSQNTEIGRVINEVSALIMLELNNRSFTANVTEVYDGAAGSTIFLRNRPVTAISGLTVNYGRQTISPSVAGAFGYVFNENTITIIGGKFGKAPGHVSVSYTYGYSTTGREQKVLERICIEEVAYRWKNRDHIGVSSVSSGGTMSTTYVQQPLQRFSVEALDQLMDVVPA
jgi:hypothetical protein